MPDRRMNPVANVACTIDEGYAQHCGVMLCSLFRNNAGVDFRIFVISDGLSDDAQQKLRSVAASHGQRLEIVPVDPGVLDGAPVSDHVSLATYFRILIPRVLPADVDRVLFLDSDVIVRGSLAELYEEQIEEYTHAAVENPLAEEALARLSIPAGHAYFNAGVLLLNLKRWRHEGLVEKILGYVKSNTDKLRWWDQDALNAMLYARWKKMAANMECAGGVFHEPHVFGARRECGGAGGGAFAAEDCALYRQRIQALDVRRFASVQARLLPLPVGDPMGRLSPTRSAVGGRNAPRLRVPHRARVREAGVPEGRAFRS